MFFKKKNQQIFASVNGVAKPISEVKDDMFAQNMMGLGLAIYPMDKMICAPVNGQITLIASTLHAFGIKTDDGLEILVHIGVDTVKYHGQGFKQLVEVGTTVKAQTPIIEFDYEFFEEAKLDTSVMTIILNHDQYKISDVLEDGNVDATTIVASYNNK